MISHLEQRYFKQVLQLAIEAIGFEVEELVKLEKTF